ncbi:hypothetical protein H2201_000877 [Coniosporium apollinis]|uniref:DUF2406 domain-containing protein n=1 Tax=Coniosporium apollinis TaxID=61459 RepID=A0ABQ9P6V8_9PEZI|nr:hypothetical protein H2201_000877 [Coniosporium apollinis]
MEAPKQRPRSKSTFSFKSDKSEKSSKAPKLPKEKLTESAAEKHQNHLSTTTKANPNAAMEEAQPIAAALEKPTLALLRASSYTDRHGNLITEPDLSNPTRPRWERPLDTIRSFEAAIDTEYKRRSTMMRSGGCATQEGQSKSNTHQAGTADSSPNIANGGFDSRRSSYYGHDNFRNLRSSQVGGYYGNQVGVRESFVENSYGGPPMAGPSKNRFSQRLQNEPPINGYGNRQGVYPTHVPQLSRDTVNTGESSQSEPWGNSTDPSSENSSIDKVASMTRVMEPNDPYVYNNYGGPVNAPGPAGPNGHLPQSMSSAPPAVPAHGAPPNRSAPIKLGGAGFPQPLNSTSGNATLVKTRSPSGTQDKRKSWFKRRFSKD